MDAPKQFLNEVMRIAVPNDLLSEQSPTKERFLRSALKNFAQRGFEGTPVDIIIDDSASSPSTLYRQFGNKEGLANELIRVLQLEYFDYLSQARQDDDVISNDCILKILSLRIGYGIYFPARHQFLREQDHSAYLSEALKKRTEQSRKQELEFVKQAQAVRIFRSGDPQIIIGFMKGGINHVVRLIHEGRIPLTKSTFEDLLTSAWAAIRF